MVVSISRLGDDVLAHVFRFCAPSPAMFDLRHTFLAFSHVCRHWRRVALQNPRIWTQLDPNLPKLALQMLQRAKHAPITIWTVPLYLRLDDRTIDCELVAAVLRKHATLGDVRLLGRYNVVNTLFARMTDPMPFLTRLKLVTIKVCDGNRSLRELSCPALEKFATPRLRQLALSNVSIPWKSRCLENLTSLELVVDDCTPSHRALTELFQSFTRIPHLGFLRLCIEDAWPDESSGWDQFADFASEVGCIRLDSLTSLSLRAPTTLVIQILQLIVMPRLRSLQVENADNCDTIPTATALLSAIHKCYAGPIHVKAVRLDNRTDHLNVQVNDEIDFSALDSNTGPNFGGRLALLEGAAEAFFDSDSNPLLASLHAVLECQLYNVDNEEIWSRIRDWITTLPHLRMLEAATRSSCDRVLGLLEDISWNPSDAQLPFPCLRTLRFYDAPLVKDGSLRRLATILKRMKDHGQSVQAVLYHCYISADEVKGVADEFGLLENEFMIANRM